MIPLQYLRVLLLLVTPSGSTFTRLSISSDREGLPLSLLSKGLQPKDFREEATEAPLDVIRTETT